MQESLEEFIKNNRKAFDEEQLEKGASWDAIRDQIPTNHRKKKQWWLIAASLAGILLAATAYLNWPTHQSEVVSEVQETELNQLKELEQHYQAMGETLERELTRMEYPDPTLKTKFKNDLGHLSSEYNQLRKEFTRSADKRQVIDALIRNMNARINLLLKQQEILKHIQSLKSKKNETFS